MDCKQCGEEATDFVTVEVGGRRRKVCEACAEAVIAEAEVQEGAEAAMQGMMAYRGRR